MISFHFRCNFLRERCWYWMNQFLYQIIPFHHFSIPRHFLSYLFSDPEIPVLSIFRHGQFPSRYFFRRGLYKFSSLLYLSRYCSFEFNLYDAKQLAMRKKNSSSVNTMHSGCTTVTLYSHLVIPDM